MNPRYKCSFARTSVKVTANPRRLLSLGLASPRTRRRTEYATSGEFSASNMESCSMFPTALVPCASSFPPLSSSFEDASDWVDLCSKDIWNFSSVPTSLTDASRRFFLSAEESSQKRGSVVDIEVQCPFGAQILRTYRKQRGKKMPFMDIYRSHPEWYIQHF